MPRSAAERRPCLLQRLGPGILSLLFLTQTLAQEKTTGILPAVVSLDSSALAGFDDNPPAIQNLLNTALALTKRNLGYLYGSADPTQKGMDCSGTIFFLLQQAGVKDVPRSADEQYTWAKTDGTFQAVQGRNLDAPELNSLRPGDLLFWTGTYAVNRKGAVSHVMIYLGKAKSDGLPLMVGASDGRTYRGKKYFGVSVFEFRLPAEESKSTFIGYARIPGLNRGT